jgi:rhomboid protease GluP
MPKQFQSSMSIGTFTPGQFLMLASHAFTKLGWQNTITSENTIIAETGASGRSWGEEISIIVNGQQAEIVSKLKQWQLTDWGKNQKNILKTTSTIEQLKAEFTPKQLEEAYNADKAKAIDEAQALADRVQGGTLTAGDKMMLGVGGYHVTYTLIGINLLVFIIMAISGVSILDPTGLDILNWGGNMRAFTASGEWWRLITCVFVHIGIIHLFLNMYALYMAGIYLEPVLGKWKFLVAYLSTGALASVASMWWSGERVSAGASGAIFGLYGFFLALLTTNLMDRNVRKPLLQSIAVFVVYSLIYGMKGNIDNAAHIGGLVSGFVLGYVFYFMEKKKTDGRLFPAAAIALTLVISIAVLRGKDDDSVRYEKVLNEFVDLEEKALQPLQEHDSLSSAEFIRRAETISVPAFKRMQELMKEAEAYKLPERGITHRSLLGQYAALRMQHIQTYIKAEKDPSPENMSAVKDLARQIEDVINTLNKTSSQ